MFFKYIILYDDYLMQLQYLKHILPGPPVNF